MVERSPHDEQVCPKFHAAIEVIGRRWTGAIVFALCQRPRRFSEFKEAIPELSDRLLAERLKELEEHGLVAREVAAGRPVSVSYCLTAKGEALRPILQAIGEWAASWQASAEAARAEAPCSEAPCSDVPRSEAL